jgi:hypothetical protein
LFLRTPNERKFPAAAAFAAVLVSAVSGVLVMTPGVRVFAACVLVMPSPVLCRWHNSLPFGQQMKGEFNARLGTVNAAWGLNVEFVRTFGDAIPRDRSLVPFFGEPSMRGPTKEE